MRTNEAKISPSSVGLGWQVCSLARRNRRIFRPVSGSAVEVVGGAAFYAHPRAL